MKYTSLHLIVKLIIKIPKHPIQISEFRYFEHVMNETPTYCVILPSGDEIYKSSPHFSQKPSSRPHISVSHHHIREPDIVTKLQFRKKIRTTRQKGCPIVPILKLFRTFCVCVRGGGVALPNLTEDFYVCQMPEYDEKQKSPPGPQFRGTV